MTAENLLFCSVSIQIIWRKCIFFSYWTIGKLLLQADKVFRQCLDVPGRPARSQGGRPTSLSIFEALGEHHIATSEASLRETTYVAITVSKFPMLSFVNEPISHLASPAVRSMIDILSDTMLESGSIPTNIATAYNSLSPYVVDASALSSSSFSPPVSLDLLVPNDGDGIVELSASQPNVLDDAVFHRLYSVDAPELYSTSFINVNGNILRRRNGHLSHLALHFYLHSFSKPKGTALIFKENPRFGRTPVDKYLRPLSSFWFAWFQVPSSAELQMLDAITEVLHGQEGSVRSRLMSNFSPRTAETEKPFFLHMNALLVVSGFCYTYAKWVVTSVNT